MRIFKRDHLAEKPQLYCETDFTTKAVSDAQDKQGPDKFPLNDSLHANWPVCKTSVRFIRINGSLHIPHCEHPRAMGDGNLPDIQS